MSKPRLLVVDDEPGTKALVSQVAVAAGFKARATDDRVTFKKLYSPEVRVIVLDLVVPGLDAVELIRFLSAAHSSASILLMTSLNSPCSRRFGRSTQTCFLVGTDQGIKVRFRRHSLPLMLSLASATLFVRKVESVFQRALVGIQGNYPAAVENASGQIHDLRSQALSLVYQLQSN